MWQFSNMTITFLNTIETVFILFLFRLKHVLLTLSSVLFFFFKLCTVTVSRNLPARNPERVDREGAGYGDKRARRTWINGAGDGGRGAGLGDFGGGGYTKICCILLILLYF